MRRSMVLCIVIVAVAGFVASGASAAVQGDYGTYPILIAQARTGESLAAADPLPGQILKFQQKPMVGTPVDGALYFGHDEWSTLYAIQPDNNIYQALAMADDFADRATTPVLHVKW